MLGLALASGCASDDGASGDTDTEGGSSSSGDEDSEGDADSEDSTSGTSGDSDSDASTTTTSDPSTSTSTTDDTSDPTSDSGSTGEETGGSDIPPMSAACGQSYDASWLSPYQLTWGAMTTATQVQVGALMRDYIVVMPPNYDPNVAYPVHIVFHAWTSTPDNAHGQHPENRWDEPVIAIAPRGQGVQGGGFGWEWWETDSIDYDFFEAMMEDLGDHVCVDNQRVFASGTSNGAYFAEMLGCLHGEWIAGVGGSAGGMPVPASSCQSPATAFLMHGTADTVVPISEGRTGRDAYLAINGCSDSTEPAAGGQCVRYNDCDSGDTVVWCEHGGGHPGADPNALGLSEAMIDEFQGI